MSSYCTKNKLPCCSCFWGYLIFFVTVYHITSWNQTWNLHCKRVLMWQFYKSHLIANTKTLVRVGDVKQLPCSGPQKYNTKFTHPGCRLIYVHPSTLCCRLTYISNTFLSINVCAIYLHFSTSPMSDMASHNYILCYVCACKNVQLCGSISEHAGFPVAFLTEV